MLKNSVLHCSDLVLHLNPILIRNWPPETASSVLLLLSKKSKLVEASNGNVYFLLLPENTLSFASITLIDSKCANLVENGFIVLSLSLVNGDRR